MINLEKNTSADAGEICLTCELSHSGKTEAITQQAANGAGAEIVRLVPVGSSDRSQLKAAQRIEASLRYMMQHLDKPIKVSTLSAMVGLSDSSFFVLFKSATGRAPLDFFIRARMQRAGELLEGTTLQIKGVATILGYDDPFYFSRLFKLIHGIAPREYRARKKKSNPQNLKMESVNHPAVTVDWPSHLPNLSAIGENKIRESALTGLQSATQRAKAFPGNRRESSSQLNQTCSVPVYT
jgi:AraC-like DNA-binding protein